MGTKMKGLLKGLRYISQIFDEEKDKEIQIGFPTDVKHVAHIGWDGPSIDSPSWMKEFKAPGQFQSAPLDMTGAPRENSESKWGSEDGSHRSTRSEGSRSPTRDLPELPKSSRHRHSSMENALETESLSRDSSTKSRHTRRHHSKGSSENSTRGSRHAHDPTLPPDSPSLPDIPKKSRRKKSKECMSGGSTRSSSRSKANNSASNGTYSSQISDLGSGPDSGLIVGSESQKENSQTPFIQE